MLDNGGSDMDSVKEIPRLAYISEDVKESLLWSKKMQMTAFRMKKQTPPLHIDDNKDMRTLSRRRRMQG